MLIVVIVNEIGGPKSSVGMYRQRSQSKAIEYRSTTHPHHLRRSVVFLGISELANGSEGLLLQLWMDAPGKGCEGS